MRKKIGFRHFDKMLFVAPILIFLVGILSLYSASFRMGQTLGQTFATKQLLWMAIGILLVFLAVRHDYFKLQDFVWPVYILTLFLLVLVLFMPARFGAHRWIGIAGFNLQPSELAKLAVVFALSRFFAAHRIEFISKDRLLVPFGIVAAPFFLVLIEPDLGTALSFIPVFFAMLYHWGFKGRHLLLLAVLGLMASPLFFFFLKDYQKARLLVFLNPNTDPLGAGYTIIQSKIAIGSGGLFGKGFMEGTQNQLRFVPEKHTDFIFSVIAEEGGFLASAALLLLFCLIVRRGYLIASQTPDRFGSQLACGIATMIAVQALMNLGMTMGLLPVVGVPLPLVSYGGSSVVITMIFIALLLNIKIHRTLF